jgi:hypothetical protein
LTRARPKKRKIEKASSRAVHIRRDPPGEQESGVESGEHEDVHYQNALEIDRLGGRHEDVPEEHGRELRRQRRERYREKRSVST